MSLADSSSLLVNSRINKSNIALDYAHYTGTDHCTYISEKEKCDYEQTAFDTGIYCTIFGQSGLISNVHRSWLGPLNSDHQLSARGTRMSRMNTDAQKPHNSAVKQAFYMNIIDIMQSTSFLLNKSLLKSNLLPPESTK